MSRFTFDERTGFIQPPRENEMTALLWFEDHEPDPTKPAGLWITNHDHVTDDDWAEARSEAVKHQLPIPDGTTIITPSGMEWTWRTDPLTNGRA